MEKKYKFFWDGEFSNWYPSKFEINGIEFNCGEQYMMYHKALLFGDDEIRVKVLESTSPSEQKKLGRKVKGFDPDKWADYSFNIMVEGLFCKFDQNPKLGEYIKQYKDHIIVEASPYDRIWGIGYHEDTAMLNIDDWGENRLGKVLMEVAKKF